MFPCDMQDTFSPLFILGYLLSLLLPFLNRFRSCSLNFIFPAAFSLYFHSYCSLLLFAFLSIYYILPVSISLSCLLLVLLFKLHPVACFLRHEVQSMPCASPVNQKSRQSNKKNVLINAIRCESPICLFCFMSLGQPCMQHRVIAPLAHVQGESRD